MRIGIPKERMDGERRIAITPTTCQKLVDNGFEVYIETEAGRGSGFNDLEYINSGAIICTQEEVWDSKIIVKVKEPVVSEYGFFKDDQIICGFLHLAANPDCVTAMVKSNVTAIACENIIIDGKLELLKPVSEIAGRKALFTAIGLLEQQSGGKGMLLSGTSVAEAGNVTIIGAGVVGQNAAKMAAAIGATVNIYDINEEVIAEINNENDDLISGHLSTEQALLDICKTTDVLISTVLIPGSAAPKIVTTQMVRKLPTGSVIVDVSSDQGGSVELAKVRTTHSNPTIDLEGKVYYGVPNMPAAVPRTATESIQGIFDLLIEAKLDILGDSRLISGIQVQGGKIINKHLEQSN